MTQKSKRLVKTRLLYWPIDVAVKRMVDFDLRSRDEAPFFFPEFADVSPSRAKDLCAEARDGFLADLIASPKGERLTKGNAVIHMAALRRSIQGLDSAFFTSLGLSKYEGDRAGYKAGMDVLQHVGPIQSLAGDSSFGLIYDFQDEQLKPMSLRGMNALIGDPMVAAPGLELRPGRDFGNAVDTASARYAIDSADADECEGTAKKIGHWVGAGVGGFVGGLGGKVVGESVGGTVGWIAGGPFGAAPGAVVGSGIGAAIGGTIGGEFGTDAGEVVGSWLGGVVCGGGSDPVPSKPGDVTGDDGSDPASPGSTPETGAGNSPSPSPAPSPAPSSDSGSSPTPSPAPEPDDGGNDGGDDDDDESMINPNWDDGSSSGGGEGERDPSLGRKFGARVVLSRWFNPAITDPVNPMLGDDGRTIAFDMAKLPQATKLEKGYAVNLNGFSGAFRALAKDAVSAAGLARPGISDAVSKFGKGDLGNLAAAGPRAIGGVLGNVRLFAASVAPAEGAGLDAEESLRLIGEGLARYMQRN